MIRCLPLFSASQNRFAFLLKSSGIPEPQGTTLTPADYFLLEDQAVINDLRRALDYPEALSYKPLDDGSGVDVEFTHNGEKFKAHFAIKLQDGIYELEGTVGNGKRQVKINRPNLMSIMSVREAVATQTRRALLALLEIE